MIQWLTPPEPVQSLYPDSDGKPMADSTKQFRWILVLYCGIANLYRDRPDVFVAGDLLWYAVEADPKQRVAPDVMVVFGRHKGDRGSYRQWEEQGLAPQVTFEVLSPGNTYTEMIDKLLFYEEHGVEEYYVYDPERNRLEVYVRQQEMLRPTGRVRDWTSPLLKIRFELTEQDMTVYGPDGRRFMTYEELMALYETAEKARETMQQRAEQAEVRAKEAEQRAETAEQRAEKAETGAERLAEKLRQLGIDPNGA